MTHYQPDYTGGQTVGICGKAGGVSVHLEYVTCPVCLMELGKRLKAPDNRTKAYMGKAEQPTKAAPKTCGTCADHGPLAGGYCGLYKARVGASSGACGNWRDPYVVRRMMGGPGYIRKEAIANG